MERRGALRAVPRLPSDDTCSSHRTARTDPLVAHCIVGQLRGFTEQRIVGSIKVNLIDALSHRHRVFVVGSLDCREPNGTRTACASYSFGDLERALAFVGAERLELMPSRSLPRADCPGSTPMLKEKAFYHQWEKTRRCYGHVVQYERETGVCFDWVVRSRTDHEWKSVAPPIVVLPRNAVTTSAIWSMLRSDASGILSHPRALEDHLMLVPRGAAALAMNTVAIWNDCRSADDLTRETSQPFNTTSTRHRDDTKCPRSLPNGTMLLGAECMLGIYIYENLRQPDGTRMTWVSDGRFNMQPRRAPGSIHDTSMGEVNYIPGIWTVGQPDHKGRPYTTFGGPFSVTDGLPTDHGHGGRNSLGEAKRNFYRERYAAAEISGWGVKAPPVGMSGPATYSVNALVQEKVASVQQRRSSTPIK